MREGARVLRTTYNPPPIPPSPTRILIEHLILVPKLCLGTLLGAKLCFAMTCITFVLKFPKALNSPWPSGAWERVKVTDLLRWEKKV